MTEEKKNISGFLLFLLQSLHVQPTIYVLPGKESFIDYLTDFEANFIDKV